MPGMNNWNNRGLSPIHLAEKVEAFVSRFGRLQDHPGEKLIPRFAALLGESPKSMLDVLAYAEKMRWIDSAELFIASRKLRNLRVHEHMADPLLFVQALSAKREAADRLFSVVSALEAEAEAVGLRDRLVQSLPGVPQSLDAIKTITTPWLKAVIASAARQSKPRFSSFFAGFRTSNGDSPL